MDGTAGKINCFIVEPFVPHDQEYYLCIQARKIRLRQREREGWLGWGRGGACVRACVAGVDVQGV